MSGLGAELKAYLEVEYGQGFIDKSDILRNAVDVFSHEEGYPGDESVAALLDVVAAAHQEQQESWTGPTDTDKLVRAFDALNKSGNVARHHYGATRSDGHGSIEGEARILRARGEKTTGFVYYTWQDAESVMDGQLNLAWGALGRHPGWTYGQLNETGRGIAHRIVEALRAEGLDAKWDEDVHGTIYILGLDWKARRESEKPTLPSGEQVVDEDVDAELVKKTLRAEKPPPYALTDNDEWLVRIVYLSSDGTIGAASSLVRLYDRMNPELSMANSLSSRYREFK